MKSRRLWGLLFLSIISIFSMTACDAWSSGTDPTATPNKELTDLQKSVAQLNDTVGKLGQSQAAPGATSVPAAPTATPAASTSTQNNSSAKAPASPNSSAGGSVFGQGIEHVSVLGDTGNKPEIVNTRKQGNWTVSEGPRLKDNPIVSKWIFGGDATHPGLMNPEPARWKYYPNIYNPDVSEQEFATKDCGQRPNAQGVLEKYCQVPNGMEYGEDESPFCENNPCDLVVSAQHYRYYTGDYSFGGYTCEGSKGDKGCMLVVINVMDETVTFRNQYFDNGFTVMGRYWNGDYLDEGLWGLVSNGSANMLDMPTYSHPGEVLNAGSNPKDVNAGTNCGVPGGCKTVDIRVIVVAGTDALAVLETTVSK